MKYLAVVLALFLPACESCTGCKLDVTPIRTDASAPVTSDVDAGDDDAGPKYRVRAVVTTGKVATKP